MSTIPADNYSPEELVRSGLAASQADDTPRALDLFRQAAAVAPQWAVPHFLLGSEYAAAGDYAQAEGAMARAVVVDPGFHIARYQLGLLQYSSNRPQAALVTWQPLLEQNQMPWLSLFARGFAALAQDQMDEARKLFSEGLTAPDAEPAVCADIRRVLDALDAQSAPPVPAPTELTQAHLLVAAYDKYRLH